VRFYLDETTATAFRRSFLRAVVQARWPDGYAERVNSAFFDGRSPFVDLDRCASDPVFAEWFARLIVSSGSGHRHYRAFKALADALTDHAQRSAVDRLADIVDPPPDMVVEVTGKTPRQRAMRKPPTRKKLIKPKGQGGGV
jgi:hypothetical protein